MLPEERQSFIYSYLYQHAYVTFLALAQLLNVSHMTIRRDIQMLEKDGKVTIISGGEKLNEALKQELPWQGKALVKQAALASSRRNVLVSDSSKYGKYGMFHICPLQEFDDIIHDDLLPEELQEKIKQLAINLHVVKS